MAENKQLRGVETQAMAEELAKRMKLGERDAMKFVYGVMTASGYEAKEHTTYSKPRKRDEENSGSWFGGGDDDESEE
jgi:hypothetical protein